MVKTAGTDRTGAEGADTGPATAGPVDPDDDRLPAADSDPPGMAPPGTTGSGDAGD